MERDHPKSDVQETEKSRGVFEHDIYPIFIPQALTGLVFTALSFYIGYYHGEFILSTINCNTPQTGTSASISSRLAYAICCSLPMLLSLFAGIQMTAMKRALTGAANPLSGNEHYVQIVVPVFRNQMLFRIGKVQILRVKVQ